MAIFLPMKLSRNTFFIYFFLNWKYWSKRAKYQGIKLRMVQKKKYPKIRLLDVRSRANREYNVKKMIPRPEWNLILIGWFFYSSLKYVHPCSPEDFMFRAFDMVPEPRAGHCCLVTTVEVLVVSWSTLHLNCHIGSVRHDDFQSNHHRTPPAVYRSPLCCQWILQVCFLLCGLV